MVDWLAAALKISHAPVRKYIDEIKSVWITRRIPSKPIQMEFIAAFLHTVANLQLIFERYT